MPLEYATFPMKTRVYTTETTQTSSTFSTTIQAQPFITSTLYVPKTSSRPYITKPPPLPANNPNPDIPKPPPQPQNCPIPNVTKPPHIPQKKKKKTPAPSLNLEEIFRITLRPVPKPSDYCSASAGYRNVKRHNELQSKNHLTLSKRIFFIKEKKVFLLSI